MYSSKVLTKLQWLRNSKRKRNNAKLNKRKGTYRLQLQKVRYERQLDSIKQIDKEIANLIKSSFNKKIAIILQELD